MKRVNVEQGSQEWLSWRRTVITATDASAILGNNPWNSPYSCWQRKLGLLEEKPASEAMERGKKLEPEARARFIDAYGMRVEPAVVESSEFDFLGASLDGISEQGDTLLEIKCGGAKLHGMAARGEIPQYYQDQMQHQLLVTGAGKCCYYSYDGADGICIDVFPDPFFKSFFMPIARDFWRCVALSESPALRDDDYKDMSQEASWTGLSSEYKYFCDRIKVLEGYKEQCRKDIINLCGGQNCIGAGIRVMKTSMRGRVDYEAIPELQDVDLNKYRKAPTASWKILTS